MLLFHKMLYSSKEKLFLNLKTHMCSVIYNVMRAKRHQPPKPADRYP